MYNGKNNINLLDLGDDILNIIGDYVKKDNHERMEELMKRRMTMYYRTNDDLTKILKIDYGIKDKIALRNYIIDFILKLMLKMHMLKLILIMKL